MHNKCNMTKVEWICIVPRCKSNSRVRGHFFPKNVTLSHKWKEAINNNIISNISSEELRKYRVCHLHFLPDAYICSQNRRRLKHDAVPSVNIYNNIETNIVETHDTNITELHSQFETSVSDLFNEQCGTSTQTNTQTDNELQSKISSYTNEISTSNTERVETNASQNIPNDSINEVINCPSTPKTSRSILASVTRQSQLTPKARKIYRRAVMLAKKRNQMKAQVVRYKRRLKDAKNFADAQFCKKFNTLTPAQRLFFNMQLNNIKYSPKGRRFTLNEKILALLLYKQSGSCYKLLSKLFILPSPKTLKCLLQTISLQPGINKFIFEHLQQHMAQINNDHDKLCVLMWDEMSLEANLQYDQLNDKIIGFEDWGHRRTSLIADHVLVFMIRGILKGWKIPLYYGFCKSQTKSAQLLRCIKEIIKELIKAGLKIIATVCDQGGPNMTCINSLLQDSKRECIRTGQEYRDIIQLFRQNIVPIFDPPHLLKGIRNNLLLKNLELDTTILKENERQFASWDIIEMAYKMDTYTNTLNRQVPKITDQHVIKSKIKKMKVKCAAQVFSARFSAYLEYNSKIKGGFIESQIGQLQIPNKAGYDTAVALDLFNKIFDSVNAHTLRPQTPLRVAVTKNSKHHNFWPYAIKRLSNMRYVDPKTKQPVRCIPSLKNWIFTLRGFKKIWKIIESKGIRFLKTRNINQDPLENFFGLIRSHGRRNINPSCSQFCGSYKTLLINNFTARRSVGSNCENINDGDLLFTLKQFVKNATCATNITEQTVEEDFLTESSQVKNIENMHKGYPLQESNRSYVAGWVVKKVLSMTKFKNCIACKESLLSNDTSHTEYIQLINAEYVKEKQSLTYPSMCFLKDIFIEADSVLNENIPSLCFRRNVSVLLRERVYEKLNSNFVKCIEHKEELKHNVIQVIIKLFLYTFCKSVNRILSGRDTRYVASNIIFKQAIDHYQKKQKRFIRKV